MYTFTKAEGNSNVFITDNNGNNFILPGNTQVKNDGDNIIFWITGTIGIQSISLNYQTQIDWANCDPVQSTPASITDAMNVLYTSFFFSVSGGAGGTNFWEETESTSIKNKPAYDGGYFRRIEENTGSIRVHLVGTTNDIDENSSGITILTDNGDSVAGIYVSNELSSGGFVKSVNTLQTLGYYGTFQNVGEDNVNSGFAVFNTPNGNLIVSATGNNGQIEIAQTDAEGKGAPNYIKLKSDGTIEIARQGGQESIQINNQEIKISITYSDSSTASIGVFDNRDVLLSSGNATNSNSGIILINTENENPSITFDLGAIDAVRNYNFADVPSYANHAAADADANLQIGSIYLIDSQQSVNIKK